MERSSQLDKAVSPGPTRSTDTHDYMWTTPERLFAVLDGTIKAFDMMQVGEGVGRRVEGEQAGPLCCPSLLWPRALLVPMMQAEAGKKMGSSKSASTPGKIKDMRIIRDEIMRRYL